MPTFYFETETTGFHPQTDKVISIQYQQIAKNTGEPIGPLTIHREWESNEKTILERFLNETQLLGDDPFAFVPIGYNLGFEHTFLRERFIAHNLPPLDIFSKPYIDLRMLAIIANRGELKGTTLETLTGKARNSHFVPKWYQAKQYDQIEKFIRDEAQEFLRYIQWMYRNVPDCLREYKIKSS